jgi:hypothetical protein
MIPALGTLKTYLVVGSVLAAGIGGAVGAWQVQNWRFGAIKAAELEQARETSKMLRQAANSASTGHENDKVTLKTEFVTIEKEVERVINKIEYRDRACFDPDGVRIINDAIGLTGNPGEPENGLRSPESAR